MITLENTNDIPDLPGVYYFKQEGVSIYIGKSVNLRARVRSHIQQAQLSKKEYAIVSQADTLEWSTTLSNFDALLLEAKLIREFKPKYNVLWKDDKNYLYIKITIKDQYPKLVPVRKENDGKSLYFGPFRSTYMTNTLLYELRRIVPFSTHTQKGTRGCFYSRLGYCNPCPNLIEKETRPEIKATMQAQYKKNVRKVRSILSGKTDQFSLILEKQLQEYSDNQQYEEAIIIRNKLYQFSLFLDRRSFGDSPISVDVDRSSLETDIAEFLMKNFTVTPSENHRLECYDISNLYGQEATGSMVVFSNGEFARKEYRKFKIAHKGISDINMMKEMIERRLKHDDWEKPDLMILDGGTPQLRHIDKYFRSHNISIPLISIAKRPDRILIAKNGYKSIYLDRESLLFKIIQALRDESHRFAKKYHVSLRNRNFLN